MTPAARRLRATLTAVLVRYNAPGVDGPMVWMARDCGARMARRVVEEDDDAGRVAPVHLT